MLEVTIYFIIYRCLQWFLEWPIKIKIYKARNAKDAIRLRKLLKYCRIIFFCMFLVGLYLLYYYFFYDKEKHLGGDFLRKAIMLSMLLYMFFIIHDNKKDLFGNVSFLGKDDFLQQNRKFALFLRAFEEDDYTKLDVISDKGIFEKFSEFKFVEIIQRKITVCSVGMTKESDSPYGATRIYLDDKYWEEDVRELIEKANEIYILVSDRYSCVWEIEQCREMIDKTMFIIDEKEKYENIQKIYRNEIALPPIPEDLKDSPHVVLYQNKGSFVFEKYENDIKSYTNLLSRYFDICAEKDLCYDENKDQHISLVDNSQKNGNGYEKPSSLLVVKKYTNKLYSYFKIILSFLISAFLLYFINNYISIYLLNTFNRAQRGLSVDIDSSLIYYIVVFFLYFIEWVLYMIIKVSIKTKKTGYKEGTGTL